MSKRTSNLTYLADFDAAYVVVTAINPDGESDLYWLEPADDIEDSCVAVTQPLAIEAALLVLNEIKLERDNERL